MDEDVTADEPVTDEELAELAMAADPDEPIDPDAVPILWASEGEGLLPEWYMPARLPPARGRTRRVLVGGITVAFLAINGAGLCVTFGFPEIAW